MRPFRKTTASRADGLTDEDFESSPLRFHYEPVLHEYRALREEISARIQKQQEITSFAIAIVGGFVALTQLINGSSGPLKDLSDLRYTFPIGSLIFSAFTLMTLDHEMNIAHLLRYIDQSLRPYIRWLLTERVRQSTSNGAGVEVVPTWDWNLKRSRWQQHGGWRAAFPSSLAVSKYVMTILPNLVITIAFWFAGTGAPNPFQIALYVVSILALLWVLAAATYTSTLYVTMPRED